MAKGLRKRLEKRKSRASAVAPALVPVTKPRSCKQPSSERKAEGPATEAGLPITTNTVLRLSNLHHLFGESQLRKFFSQYGEVRRIRLLRSHRTGGSKGRAYVEFAVPEVAEIAARDMHNYMLGGKLVVSKLVSLDMISSSFFKVRSMPSRTRFVSGVRLLAEALEARSVERKLQSRARRLAKQLKRLEAVGLRSVFSSSSSK